MFFEKTGPVWETLHQLEGRLDDAGIEFVVIGGLALNAHDYPRQTIDVDIVLSDDDFDRFRTAFEGKTYKPVEGAARRYMDPRHGVAIYVLIAGQMAGNTKKNSSVRFPDPSEVEVHGEIRTVSLARLIELKLVTWRFKDWGDVVELIRRNNLEASLADRLDPVVRTAYGECYDQGNDPGYDGP